MKTSHSWLAYWLDLDSTGISDGAVKALRSALSAQEISARGVRLYIDYGDQLFAPLGSKWIRQGDRAYSRENALAWLKLLQSCEMDVAPPPELARAVAACCKPPTGLGSIPAVLFRAAWRGYSQATYSGQSLEAFLESEMKPLLEWALLRHEERAFDHNQAKRGWAWLKKAWQDDCRRRALPPARREWPTLCNDAIFKGVRMIPLTCEDALEDEGAVMSHCIAGYFEPQALGRASHAFSARDPKTLDRLATVALRRTETNSWAIDDIKAHANRDAPPAVYAAAHALVAIANIRESKKQVPVDNN